MLQVLETWGNENPSLGVRHTDSLVELFDNLETLSQDPQPCSVFVPDVEAARQAAWVRTVLQVPFEIVLLTGPTTRRALTMYLINSLVEPRFHGLGQSIVDVIDPFLETRFLLSSVFSLNQPRPSLSQMLQSLAKSSVFEADVNAGSVEKITASKWSAHPDGISIEARTWTPEGDSPLEMSPAHTHFTLQAVPKDSAWGQRQGKNWVEASWTNESVDTIRKALKNNIKPRTCQRCEQYVVGTICANCGFAGESSPEPDEMKQSLEAL